MYIRETTTINTQHVDMGICTLCARVRLNINISEVYRASASDREKTHFLLSLTLIRCTGFLCSYQFNNKKILLLLLLFVTTN